MASILTPRKIGDELSRRFRNLGVPTGGLNVSMVLLFLVHLTQFLISGEIIFLTCVIMAPKLPCLIRARVADLLR